MKVSLHLEGTVEEILEQVAEFMQSIDGKTVGSKSEKPAKKGKGKKEEETFDDEESDEMPETEEEESELPEENDDAEEGEEGTTLEDVISFFRAFTAKSEANKEKAKKVLAKFKVKSVRELDENFFDSAIAALKKK